MSHKVLLLCLLPPLCKQKSHKAGWDGWRRIRNIVDIIGDPIYPSNTSISETVAEGMVYIRIAGGGRIASTEDGVGKGNQKSTSSPHN